MSERESGGSTGGKRTPAALSDALDAYLTSKSKGRNQESGTYRRNAERELEKFIDYITTEQDCTALDEIDAKVLREYIRDELGGEGHSPRTVRKYYDYVSAWIGWAQREGLVDTHYGIQEAAKEPLPETDTRKEKRQQSWHRKDRERLFQYVDRQAHDAIDEDGLDAYKPVRDRALAYVLAYTGVRSSECLAIKDDDRRDGARWRDLADDHSSILVLGKSQEWEDRSIPPQARSAIEQWARVLDPEPDWPLFPTLHYPTLHGGLDDTDDVTGHGPLFDAYRDSGATPPALTTDGARRILRRLTDDAGIDVDEDYLQPHGARRGVGRVLAMELGVDAAADQLGNSVEVVEDAYSDILASERAEMTGKAFEDHDGGD